MAGASEAISHWTCGLKLFQLIGFVLFAVVEDMAPHPNFCSRPVKIFKYVEA